MIDRPDRGGGRAREGGGGQGDGLREQGAAREEPAGALEAGHRAKGLRQEEKGLGRLRVARTCLFRPLLRFSNRQRCEVQKGCREFSIIVNTQKSARREQRPRTTLTVRAQQRRAA